MKENLPGTPSSLSLNSDYTLFVLHNKHTSRKALLTSKWESVSSQKGPSCVALVWWCFYSQCHSLTLYDGCMLDVCWKSKSVASKALASAISPRRESQPHSAYLWILQSTSATGSPQEKHKEKRPSNGQVHTAHSLPDRTGLRWGSMEACKEKEVEEAGKTGEEAGKYMKVRGVWSLK